MATDKQLSPNLIQREDGTFRLDNVRISYPYIFSPDPGKPDKKTGKLPAPKYRADFLLPLASHKADIVAIRAAAIALSKESFKGQVVSAERLCVRNVSQSGKPEQDGCWLLRASEKKRPAVVGKGNVPLAEEDGVLFPGCYVSLNFRLWAQDHDDGGKRINANLLAVRWMSNPKPGDVPIEAGGGVRPEVSDVFAGFEDEEGGGLDDGLGDDLL